MKVLIHIDQTDNWSMVFENTRNMLQYAEAYKEPVDIEVLANGNAVNGLLKKTPEWQSMVLELSNRHVVFAACQNSLNKFQLKREDLFDEVMIVPAGVIELVKKQENGYAYFKP